jgi:hypothetical protein
MNFEDLQQQWRATVNQPLDATQQQQLQNEVRQRCQNLERSVRRRDLLEIAAVPVLLVWIGIDWPKVNKTWPSAIGAIVIGIWAISVAIILLRMRHQKPVSNDVPLEEFIRQKLQWCDRQIDLLKNAAWWYVFPPLAAASLLLWSKAQPHNLPRLSIMWLIMIAFGILVVRLNQRAADKHFVSLRNELTRLQNDL